MRESIIADLERKLMEAEQQAARWRAKAGELGEARGLAESHALSAEGSASTLREAISTLRAGWDLSEPGPPPGLPIPPDLPEVRP